MSKYPKFQDGETIEINLDDDELHLACCDCGVVHIIQFHRIKNNIWDFALFRNKRATGQLRRHNFGNLFQPNQTGE